MRTRVLYGVIVICCMLSVSCTTSSLKDEKMVSEENVFSSSNPLLQLKVHPDLSYLDKVKKAEIVKEYGANIAREAHLFGQIEDNIYKKGVLIRILKLPHELRWRGQVFSIDPNETLDTGTMENEGGKFHYIVMAPSLVFNEDEAEFISGEGYTIPRCYILKAVGKESRATRVYIHYFENLPSCTAWNPDALTTEQQKLFDEFIERSEASMIFQ